MKIIQILIATLSVTISNQASASTSQNQSTRSTTEEKMSLYESLTTLLWVFPVSIDHRVLDDGSVGSVATFVREGQESLQINDFLEVLVALQSGGGIADVSHDCGGGLFDWFRVTRMTSCIGDDGQMHFLCGSWNGHCSLCRWRTDCLRCCNYFTGEGSRDSISCERSCE